MKLIKTNAMKVMGDMHHTNIVTFNNNAPTIVKMNGENYNAISISCYNLEVILDGEKVCINPMNYHGECREMDFFHIDSFERDDLWVFYNAEKVLLYNSTDGDVVGEITKLLDPRDISERLRDMRARGEI